MAENVFTYWTIELIKRSPQKRLPRLNAATRLKSELSDLKIGFVQMSLNLSHYFQAKL